MRRLPFLCCPLSLCLRLLPAFHADAVFTLSLLFAMIAFAISADAPRLPPFRFLPFPPHSAAIFPYFRFAFPFISCFSMILLPFRRFFAIIFSFSIFRLPLFSAYFLFAFHYLSEPALRRCASARRARDHACHAPFCTRHACHPISMLAIIDLLLPAFR